MRPVSVIPGPGDPNQPMPSTQPSQPEPLVQPPNEQPVTPQEVPGEPKHYPIHREIPTQPIHEGGLK